MWWRQSGGFLYFGLLLYGGVVRVCACYIFGEIGLESRRRGRVCFVFKIAQLT